MSPALPATEEALDLDQELEKLLQEELENSKTWRCIVHDDPVHTIDYVVLVFMSYFLYDFGKAYRLTLQVHEEGRASVAEGTKELMEVHMQAMHRFGLLSTIEPAPTA